MAGTSKANLRQTATNVAADLTVGFTQAGFFNDIEEAKAFFAEQRNEAFEDLEKFPTATGGVGGSRGAGQSGGGSIDNPGSVKFKGGKFKGLTVEAVAALTASQCAEYGYVDQKGEETRTGLDYLEWVEGNKKNPFMQKVVAAFKEQRRAGTASTEPASNPDDQTPATKPDGSDW